MNAFKNHQFSGPVTIFHGRQLPEAATPARYAALNATLYDVASDLQALEARLANNVTDQNLKGEDAPGNADVTGYVGATYDMPVAGGWRWNLSADARYSGEYAYTQTLDPYMQDSF
ncbi:MAG: hypothetical protein OXF31_11505 [Gammaproteobacteria bacterium]|nr:hypothetical protein [Gammaproteobacteria bacterium]